MLIRIIDIQIHRERFAITIITMVPKLLFYSSGVPFCGRANTNQFINIVMSSIIILSTLVDRTYAQIEQPYRIEEELAPNTTFGNIVQDTNIAEFADPSEIADLRFTFLNQGDPDVSYFSVNSTTGELKTYLRIDRETVCRPQTSCQFRLEAAVRAQIGPFFMVVFINVEIIDINDNSPTFTPTTFNLQIPEDETTGSSFRLPSASDPDMGEGYSVVAYSLSEYDVASSGQSGVFSLIVDGRTSSDFVVHLKLETPLDRELMSSYTYLLEARDGGSESLTGTLTINIDVVDKNDNPPVFDRPLYVANISEITALNKNILTVTARDRDAGVNAELTYSMPLTQEDPAVFSMFSINETSGEIKTKIPLDPYAGGSYSFTVKARDTGSTPLTATTEVTIHIKDTHNSDPEIRLNLFPTTDKAQVSELAELGRAVAYVAVRDPDSSLTPNGIVTCSVNSDQFDLQAMDVDKYKVILTRRLNREKQATHSLTVSCQDSGSPPLNSSASFEVEVLDENDQEPVFDSAIYNIEVVEGARQVVGQNDRDVIVRVHATDADTGINAELSYRLDTDNSDSDFGIYADGSIVITNSDGLDREDMVKGQTRELTVLAVDGGEPALTGTAIVRVNILDINDNAPIFSEPMYYFSAIENSPTGTVVNNVTATDADTASNGLFYFQMGPTDERSVPFQVTANGSITVSGLLDREAVSDYRFHLIAYDIGQPALLSSSVLVNIHITDINDNRPMFTFPNNANNTLHIPHTLSINTGFGHIEAKDLDIGKNAQLRYSSDSGNGTKYVDILPDTGEIVLIRTLTVHDIGPHYLIVAVHDLGTEEQLATQTTLQIIVYEGNATVAVKDESKGFRNVVVVVVLVVVTVALGLAILLTIVLIQRVDKQRRRYHAKEAEAKVDSNLRHLNPVLDIDIMESATDLANPSGGGDSKVDISKKKKEVSFSLDEDNNTSQSSTSRMMTSFGTGSSTSSDKYDPLPDRERCNTKGDILLLSGLGKKEANAMTTFHQVHPSYSSARQDHSSHHHDDNLSDVSADVSTSDSGRGGSDVELQSHGGNSKDSGDTSFTSQQTNPHNNLNMSGPGRNVNASGSNLSRNISNSNNSIGNHNNSNPNMNYSSRNLSNKSVHFQNIHPDPMSSFRSAISAQSHPMKSQRPTHPPYTNNYSTGALQNTPGRYTPNIYVTNEDDGSYVKLANHNEYSPKPTNHSLDSSFRGHPGRHDNNGRYPSSVNRYTPTTFYPTNENSEYMDMGGARGTILHPRTNSTNSCLEGATAGSSASAGWDGDTTTSGSYTVDPHELCEEIDKLFFDEVKDVVV